MRRATSVIFKADLKAADVKGTVTLAFEDRFRRRVKMTDDAGEDFLLDLAQATRVEDGDALTLDTGGVLLIKAAIEDVLDITAQNPLHAAKLAWHVGNRHTALEVLADGRLRILDDHVMQHMLEGLGATLAKSQAPFSPESGAYDTEVGHHAHHAHG